MKPAPATAAKKDSPALYGAFEELSTAAEAGLRAARAVFPLLRPSNPFLAASQRDALWDMFQVPVFALLLDTHGSVIAYECEAQEGLHLRDGHQLSVPFGRVEKKLCECGRPGPRLMPPRPATASDTERMVG